MVWRQTLQVGGGVGACGAPAGLWRGVACAALGGVVDSEQRLGVGAVRRRLCGGEVGADRRTTDAHAASGVGAYPRQAESHAERLGDGAKVSRR